MHTKKNIKETLTCFFYVYSVKLRNSQGKLILRTIPNRYFMDEMVDRYVEDEEGMEGFAASDIDRKINRAISSGYDPTFTQHLRNRRTLVKE